MPEVAQSDSTSAEAIRVVRQLNDAISLRDVDAVMALMAEDVVWELTTPPDGVRYEGRAAVRAAGLEMFGGSAESRFEEEEIFAAGDRVVQLWTYHWVDNERKSGHVRGVDVMRVRDGKVAETLSYVKG